MGATRGQHYLPQFLMRGFASRTESKKVWVYYFRRSAPGKEVSIKDIGKETDFHGNPRDGSLETQMAQVESIFGSSVARWREVASLSEADKELVSQFVGHLIVRTKNLRDAFTAGAQVLMDELARRLERGELNPLREPDIEAAMVKRISQNPAFKKMARQKPREFRALIKTQLLNLTRSGKPLEWSREMARHARTMDIKKPIAQGHIKALTEGQIPAVRVQIPGTLDWSVFHTDQPEIVLGDVGAIARETNDSEFKHPLSLDFNKISLLCCPIGSTTVLVGRADGQNLSFSADELNRAGAELSREFFVASQLDKRSEGLRELLGRRADILSPEEIRELIPKEMPRIGQED